MRSEYHYTKIKRWVTKYSSMYEIVNIFCVLNHINMTYAMGLFKPQIITKYTFRPKVQLLGTWNYNNVTTFCPTVIERLTLISRYDLLPNYITSIINQNDLLWATSVDSLRYCPICLTLGYHSIFHQINFFTHCPIHMEPLTDICLNCKSTIPYQLKKNRFTGFTCSSCGTPLWVHVEEREGELCENRLDLTDVQIAELDELFRWLQRIKKSIVFSPRISRENYLTLQQSGKPYIDVTSIYSLWSEIVPPPKVESLKLAPTELGIHVKVRFGSRTTEEPHILCRFQDCKKTCEINYEKKWVLWGRTICHLDITRSLPPIYKAIRRYIFKLCIRDKGLRCHIPKRATLLFFNFSKPCDVCEFGRAFYIWRKFWEGRGHSHRDTIYWENSYPMIDGVRNDFAARWVILYLFALECLWTFRQAIFLVEQLPEKIEREEIRLGCLAFFFSVEVSGSPQHPTFHYWTKSSGILPTFNCVPCDRRQHPT